MNEIKKIELITEIETDNKTVLFNHIQENEEEFEELELEIKQLDQKLENIQLTPGEKGERGEPGYTPIKNVDYFDGEKGADGKTPVAGVDFPLPKDGYTPIKGVDYFDGKDGVSIKGEKGDKPKHRWKGTQLQFEKPDGTWGQLTDLRGLQGQIGLSGGSLGASYPGVKLNNQLLTTGAREFNFTGGITASVVGTSVTISTDDLSGYIPYTGANQDVNLGVHSISGGQGTFNSVSVDNLYLDNDTLQSVGVCLALNSADCIEFKSNNVLKGEVDSTGFHIGDHGVGTSTSVPLYIYDNYGASVKIQAVKMNYSAGYTLLTPDPTLAQESFTIVTSSAVNAAKKIAVFDDTYDVTSYADFQFNSATNTITIGGAGTQGSIDIVNGARTLTLRAPSSTYTLTFPPVPVGTTQTPQLATTGVMTTILNTGTGNNVLATSPTIVTPAITTSAVITRNNIAATPSYGLYMRNTTASTSGVPVQLSPAIELFGSGWDTDGSVSVGLNSQIYLGFLSGTTVHGQLRFDLNQSGGSSETRMWLNDTGELGLDGATNPQSILSIGGNGISGAGLFVGNTAYGYKQVVFSDGSGEELFSVSGDVGATTSLISLGDVNDAYSYARLDVTYDKAKLWNGNLEVVQDIISEAYITGKKSGIFAYLSASANTTITTAGTYYYINGSFTNSPIENFSLVADPAIRYDGTKTQHFETDWHATISADIANTTVTIGIKKNGTLVTSSLMSTFCKNVGELYNLSGTTVVELATNDKIQLVVTSDGSGDIITFNNFTTTINEFFD